MLGAAFYLANLIEPCYASGKWQARDKYSSSFCYSFKLLVATIKLFELVQIDFLVRSHIQ